MRSVRWAVVLGVLLAAPPAARAGTEGSWVARIRANDAPIAGRLTIYGYLLDSLDVAVPLPGPGRLLALNVREANGENSFMVSGDLAIEGRRGTRWRGGFVPLADLAGYVGEGESRWGLWWIPAGSDSLEWNSLADLRLAYGFSKSLFVPMDAAMVRTTLKAIPWEQARGAVVDPARTTADPERAIDPVAFDQFPEIRERKDPVYPQSAKLYAFDGSVHVVAEVDATGRVADAWVLQSNAVHDLNVAALSAVMDWVFRPGKKDGKAVAGEMVIPVRFSSGWSR